MSNLPSTDSAGSPRSSDINSGVTISAPNGSPSTSDTRLSAKEIIVDIGITPGSREYTACIIIGWASPQVQAYLRDILLKDPLLWNEFELTEVGLRVKIQSRILDAHFGDLRVDNSAILNIRVVPGVILKRLIASIFGIDFYAVDQPSLVSIKFASGAIPGSYLSFEMPPFDQNTAEYPPPLSLIREIHNQRNTVATLSSTGRLMPEALAELREAAIKPRTQVVDFNPKGRWEFLAQGENFRLALNTGVIDPERQIYQTELRYPRQIATHAILNHQAPSIVFTRNKAGDYEVPWEIVEEAVCQAATIAVQKYVFVPERSPWSSKAAPASETLVVLSRSTIEIHRSALMSEREMLSITLKVDNTKGPTCRIVYMVTSSPQANLVASGTITGTRVPKKALAESLYPKD